MQPDVQILRTTAHRISNMLQSLNLCVADLMDVIAGGGDAVATASASRIEERSTAQMQELRILLGVLWDVTAWKDGSLVYQPSMINVFRAASSIYAMFAEQDIVIVPTMSTTLTLWADPVRLTWILNKYVHEAVRRAQGSETRQPIRLWAGAISHDQVAIIIREHRSIPDRSDTSTAELLFCQHILAQGNGSIDMTDTAITLTFPAAPPPDAAP